MAFSTFVGSFLLYTSSYSHANVLLLKYFLISFSVSNITIFIKQGHLVYVSGKLSLSNNILFCLISAHWKNDSPPSTASTTSQNVISSALRASA